MERAVKVERMMVRWKAPRIGDDVVVRSSEIYFQLPHGLPEFTRAVLVGREPGRYIVEALGRIWNIPFQCLEHEEECLLHGRWIDKGDRRVRRVKAMLDRIQTQEQLKAARRRDSLFCA